MEDLEKDVREMKVKWRRKKIVDREDGCPKLRRPQFSEGRRAKELGGSTCQV